MKKFWIILICAIALILAGLGVWYFYFKSNVIQERKEISREVLENQFGFLSGPENDASFIKSTDAKWVRPHPGPFLWDRMQESQDSEIDFSTTDKIVKKYQENDLAILATLWPYADWDQKSKSNAESCKVSENDQFSKEIHGAKDEDYISLYRCNPENWSAYQNWLQAVIERYDGDGENDMPGLEIPIKYWEVMNEPELNGDDLDFYQGTATDYAELLKRSYGAIHNVDHEANVLIAGAAGMSQESVDFFKDVLGPGEMQNYFDIGNVHCISNSNGANDYNVAKYFKMMKDLGIDKLVWVTEAEEFSGDAEKNYNNTAESTKNALAAGAAKIFYTRYDFEDTRTNMSDDKIDAKDDTDEKTEDKDTSSPTNSAEQYKKIFEEYKNK